MSLGDGERLQINKKVLQVVARRRTSIVSMEVREFLYFCLIWREISERNETENFVV
jgi:hypothetical protein